MLIRKTIACGIKKIRTFRFFSLSEPLKNPNLFIWSTVVLSISPEKGSDLLLLSGNQRLQTAVIVFPFGAYFGVIFVF